MTFLVNRCRNEYSAVRSQSELWCLPGNLPESFPGSRVEARKGFSTINAARHGCHHVFSVVCEPESVDIDFEVANFPLSPCVQVVNAQDLRQTPVIIDRQLLAVRRQRIHTGDAVSRSATKDLFTAGDVPGGQPTAGSASFVNDGSLSVDRQLCGNSPSRINVAAIG